MKKVVENVGWQNAHDMYVAKINGIGYVFCTFHGKPDFRQCMCCWQEDHFKIREAVKEYLNGSIRVIFCGDGLYAEWNLGIDIDTSKMGKDERKKAEKAVRAAFARATSR